MLRLQWLPQCIRIHSRGRIRNLKQAKFVSYFTTSTLNFHNATLEPSIPPQILKPVGRPLSILDISPDVSPNPLCSLDVEKLRHLTKRELRHLSSIRYSSMEEKADACFTVSSAIKDLVISNPKQASRIYHLLADDEMKKVVFRNVIESLAHNEIPKVYMRFIAEPQSHYTRASFTKALLYLLKSDIQIADKSNALLDFFEGVAETEMVNSLPIFIDKKVFQTILDIIGEDNYSNLYSYLLHLNIRPKSKITFTEFRESLFTVSPRSKFIANTGYINPRWFDLNKTKFNPIHTSRIIEFYSFAELKAICDNYSLQNDPARASLFLSFMVSKLEREGRSESANRSESYTKERVQVVLNCVLNLIIRFKSVSSATQVLKFMKDENFNVELESLLILLKTLRKAKEYEQFITVLTGIQLDTLKRNKKNIIVDEILLLMRDKFSSSPKVILGYVSALFGAPQSERSGIYILNELGVLSYPYESTIASKITSTRVVQAANVDQNLKKSKLTSRALAYVYQVLFNSMEKSQRHDASVINKYFHLYVDFMANNSLSEPDDKPLGVFFDFLLYVNEDVERNTVVPPGNYYLAKAMFDYYKTLDLKRNRVSSTTLQKLSRVAITKYNDFTFATEVVRFAKDKGKLLTFHQVFPFIKKYHDEGDSRRFKFLMKELTDMGVKVTSRELSDFINICRDPEPAKDAYKYKWSMTLNRRENKKALDRLSANFLPNNADNAASHLLDEDAY
ncbi:hypothetical protein CANMA_004011 [Candida margitis]|uniref:uncharacterized protein n=1 Tax=Candida margitis TaxID=1775924 RepID=UPI0022273928|nr:uncharacterized protein CANMA_004011 [Candida margitis]KAI5960231.1 hypothetical protein CANMA_004011 [Candida margitis]